VYGSLSRSCFFGANFPQGAHDKVSNEPKRLHGTIVSIQPGRRGKEKTQILTIKLDDLTDEPQELLYANVELVVQRHIALRTKR
jgi:hypothetical protein